MQCKYHSQAIIKIQQPSLRPLCEKCINETDNEKKFRLQSMRASLNKDFNGTLKQLQAEKSKLDKLIQLFVGKNMTEAKKMINKKSLEAQKVVQTSIDKQVKRANEQLKTYTAQLLEPYSQLQTIKELQQIHFEFDEEFLELEEKVEAKKKELKKQVIQKVKEQMRNFYCQIFDFSA